MKKIIIPLTLICICVSIAAENTQIQNDDIIKVNYEKKSAVLAAVLSGVVPGAGQFYVSKSKIKTYLFPIFEIGFIAANIAFNSKGDDVTAKFEPFADKHYSRDRQIEAQDNLITTAHNHGQHFYDDHFILDETDTQHYYEDIGKYNKYIFGWEDWYNTYKGADGSFGWQFDVNDKWIGNQTANGEDCDAPYSALRAEYNVMRDDANSHYRTAKWMLFGLMLNHIAAPIDAAWEARKYNAHYISSNPVKINVNTVVRNDNLTPVLFISKNF
ncbi:MAG: hypothetical protein PHR06_09300 [Candidatus Cloacimonetes bacterium]|nr:hypothetical protein [Candidatus Cloacimonadota bacterium]